MKPTTMTLYAVRGDKKELIKEWKVTRKLLEDPIAGTYQHKEIPDEFHLVLRDNLYELVFKTKPNEPYSDSESFHVWYKRWKSLYYINTSAIAKWLE